LSKEIDGPFAISCAEPNAIKPRLKIIIENIFFIVVEILLFLRA